MGDTAQQPLLGGVAHGGVGEEDGNHRSHATSAAAAGGASKGASRVSQLGLGFLSKWAFGVKCWCRKVTAGADGDIFVLSIKVGLASTLCSLLVLVPAIDTWLEGVGIWAVLTVGLVLEPNVGTSLSKGLNRVVGTSIAGALAVAVNHVAPLFGPAHVYVIYALVFLGGALPTFLRFASPLKAQWNYAAVMASQTFHLLILTGYYSDEDILVPTMRLAMVVMGFVLAGCINVVIKPVFAGTQLHSFITKSFISASECIDQVVTLYCDAAALDHVNDELATNNNNSNNNNKNKKNKNNQKKRKEDITHTVYRDLAAMKTQEEKFLLSVWWEPPHGKFRSGYPWARYAGLAAELRYSLHGIVALDGCLRSQIQADESLRDLFRPHFLRIGSCSSQVLKALGKSLAEHRPAPDPNTLLGEAEEAAVALQEALSEHSALLFKGGPVQKPACEGEGSREGNGGAGVKRATSNGVVNVASPRHGPTMAEKRARFAASRYATWRQTFSRHAPLHISSTAVLANFSGMSLLQPEGPKADPIAAISAMSLCKFAALLIEFVTRLRYVANAVYDLSCEVPFDGEPVAYEEV
eukprot:jgi/Chlat1/8617/Chrsp86S08026